MGAELPMRKVSAVVLMIVAVLLMAQAVAPTSGGTVTASNGLTASAGNITCDTASASSAGCVSVGLQTFGGPKIVTGSLFLDGGALFLDLGQTLWLNGPTNNLGLRGVGSVSTFVGGGFAVNNSSTFGSGANLTFSGGTADSSGSIASSSSGANIFLQSAIGASAATTAIAAFHIKHTNGALAATDLEFLSEDSAGTDLLKWDETGLATIRQGVALGTTLITLSAAAPTISSGFGTSPSIVSGNAASFRVNVGTGGSASTGVIGLPTASVNWHCTVQDITSEDTMDTRFVDGTTTSASFKNYSMTTGLVTAWTASDVLSIGCTAH